MSTPHEFTVDAARAAAADDTLAAWVVDFLASPGSDNAELGKQLKSDVRHWHGPVQLPFDQLHRLAGPPDQPTLTRLTDDDLDTVDDMEASIDEGWDPPPLVVTFQHGQLVVEDGNHRIEGLRRAGETSYWAIVGFETTDERDDFLASTPA